AHDERPADALAVQVALLDAQVIEHGDVVGRVRVPAVARAAGTARPAAGVALIHHDHAEVSGKLGDRVHRCGRPAPDLDGRLQPRRRERENGGPSTGLLEIDGSVPVLDGRHARLLSSGIASLPEIPALFKREDPRLLPRHLAPPLEREILEQGEAQPRIRRSGSRSSRGLPAGVLASRSRLTTRPFYTTA